MIFRLSQELNTKIKGGPLLALPLGDNRFTDWSAAVFLVRRTQYILLSNTNSLYSTVFDGKGITDASSFIDQALNSIRSLLEDAGHDAVYRRFIAPATGTVRFARALNRSVTGCMNDLRMQATYWLQAGELAPADLGPRLNEVLLSPLKLEGRGYRAPEDVFAAMVSQAGT